MPIATEKRKRVAIHFKDLNDVAHQWILCSLRTPDGTCVAGGQADPLGRPAGRPAGRTDVTLAPLLGQRLRPSPCNYNLAPLNPPPPPSGPAAAAAAAA